jgi:hypothetical protein
MRQDMQVVKDMGDKNSTGGGLEKNQASSMLNLSDKQNLRQPSSAHGTKLKAMLVNPGENNPAPYLPPY